jgi:tetratricopeptide (TPR) repeat protein
MRFPKLNIPAIGGTAIGSTAFSSTNFLRITLAAGLILLVLAGGVLTVFYLIERSGSKETRRQDNFFSMMREYDRSVRINAGTEREFDRLNRELDRLEKKAIGVESRLSVLKRRRDLARIHPPSTENYNNSIKRSLKAYPQSQPLAAFAAAALVRDSAVTRQGREQLREWLSLLDEPAFNSLRLSLHVLLGDFRSPQSASRLPQDIVSDGSEIITTDLAILKILRADYRGASADIQTLLVSSPSPSVDALRFAAEYYYDFGDPRRSAQLFSFIDNEAAMIRQADALYLAGFTDSARSLWSILEDSPIGNSLYNLAVTTDDHDEAAAFLEKLAKTDTVSGENSRQFGLIRYSRLFDYDGAIAILQNDKLPVSKFPYIDLEICRRQGRYRERDRQVADAWLLLDRHLENEDLYEWAAWLMFFQQNYREAGILIKRIDDYGFTQQWAQICRAIYLMRDGDLETAENILRSVPAESAEWPVFANLGRILEARRSPAPALEQYEIAVSKLQNPRTASRVQLRAARCLFTIGRRNDARRALEYALELDPDNISVRLELDRTLAP